MKRFLVLLIALSVMIFSFGCGKGDDAASSSEESREATSEVKDVTEESNETEAISEESKEEPSEDESYTESEESSEQESIPDESSKPEETSKPENTEKPAANSIEGIREQLKADGESMVGMIYIDAIFATDNFEENAKNIVKNSDMAKKYPIVKEIVDKKTVSVPGTEIWLIVPIDDKADVSVYTADFETDGLLDLVYSGKGEPFVLICNVSDIWSNCRIIINYDGKTETTYPFVPLW